MIFYQILLSGMILSLNYNFFTTVPVYKGGKKNLTTLLGRTIIV